MISGVFVALGEPGGLRKRASVLRMDSGWRDYGRRQMLWPLGAQTRFCGVRREG